MRPASTNSIAIAKVSNALLLYCKAPIRPPAVARPTPINSSPIRSFNSIIHLFYSMVSLWPAAAFAFGCEPSGALASNWVPSESKSVRGRIHYGYRLASKGGLCCQSIAKLYSLSTGTSRMHSVSGVIDWGVRTYCLSLVARSVASGVSLHCLLFVNF